MYQQNDNFITDCRVMINKHIRNRKLNSVNMLHSYTKNIFTSIVLTQYIYTYILYIALQYANHNDQCYYVRNQRKSIKDKIMIVITAVQQQQYCTMLYIQISYYKSS